MMPALPPAGPALRIERCCAGIRRLWHSRRGVGLVEFALTAPILVALALGVLEISRGARINNLVTSVASTMASLVAVQPSVNAVTLADICTGAKLVMRPYPTGNLSIAVASYTYNGSAAPTLDWEDDTSCGTTAGALGTSGASLASSVLVAANDSTIVVRATYTYTLSYLSIISYRDVTRTTSNPILTQTAYQRPRYTKVACTAPC